MSHLLAISGGAIAGIVFGALALAILVAFFCIVPVKAFFSSVLSGAFVNPFKLAGLRFRKVDYSQILTAFIMGKKAGLGIKFNALEAHFLAGGSCQDVVAAMIKAKDTDQKLTFAQATAIDLSTHDVLAAVESVITPKVLEVISKSTTKDNFELEATAKIAVKAKLDKVVGALGIQTLQDKVNKYVSGKISALTDHKNATAATLSQDILSAGLDKNNGFQLLSVDITKISVLQDIGSLLAMQELEKIKVQAQIDADRQKNYAMIQESQQRIKTQEMKTAVLEAEAEVPMAIAEAIRDGRFSVMDYYKLMNLQADTAMRRAVLNSDERK